MHPQRSEQRRHAASEAAAVTMMVVVVVMLLLLMMMTTTATMAHGNGFQRQAGYFAVKFYVIGDSGPCQYLAKARGT